MHLDSIIMRLPSQDVFVGSISLSEIGLSVHGWGVGLSSSITRLSAKANVDKMLGKPSPEQTQNEKRSRSDELLIISFPTSYLRITCQVKNCSFLQLWTLCGNENKAHIPTEL